MDTVFPDAPGFAGFFLIGFRKDPGAPTLTRRTGTFVLKRAYDVIGGPLSGALVPASSPAEIVMADETDDADNVLYESDVAPYKPLGDLIVLGFTATTGLHQLRVAGTARLQRDLLVAGEPALFGWEPRVNEDHPERRQDQAGGFSEDPNDYPLEFPFDDPIRDPLPGGPGDPRALFDNRFHNGYSRTAAIGSLPHLAAGQVVEIRRDGNPVYTLTLGAEQVAAHVELYTGKGADKANRWRREPVTAIALDTLTLEPDDDRCALVWRGVWDYDVHPADAYRRLVVTVEA